MMQRTGNLHVLRLATLLLPLASAHLAAASSSGKAATGSIVQDLASAFEDFKVQHGRNYEADSAEHHQRLALFSQRFVEVEQQNARPGRLWTAGINAFSDRTDVELAQLRGWRGVATGARGRSGAIATDGAASTGTFLRQRSKGRKLPRSFMNWTKLTSSQNIKNQGGCGSCWAVATSNVLEAHSEIHKKGRTFSAQELVDCV